MKSSTEMTDEEFMYYLGGFGAVMAIMGVAALLTILVVHIL